MPTRTDYELAATKFTLAADQVGTLTTAAENADAASILRGGSLGQQVPDRIITSAVTASNCKDLIESAAQTCLERARIIAEYEAELEAYDIALELYKVEAKWWQAEFNAWMADRTYTYPHPGHEPVPPVKPVPPPLWADVRRP